MLIPHIKKTTGDVLVHFRKRVPGRINAEAVSAKKPGWNHRAAAVKWHPLTLRFSPCWPQISALEIRVFCRVLAGDTCLSLNGQNGVATASFGSVSRYHDTRAWLPN